DLLAAVFPEQVGCQDNHTGPLTPPDHPLVNQTLTDCLEDALDVEGLVAVVEALERGEVQTVAVDTPQPSPMSHEILSANPYAFLDDAPLEERRARAVSLRRVDPELAAGPGALDPDAIEEVRAQARPDVRDADELHDLLQTVTFLPRGEAQPWESFASELVRAGRAVRVEGEGLAGYAARERADAVRAIDPGWSRTQGRRRRYPGTQRYRSWCTAGSCTARPLPRRSWRAGSTSPWATSTWL
ncbi:MAG: DEAD/DEAH box helicase, partial [Firmicutes bacterium]|nr:DEAD/DEAH box helicase [Bacillota bacterium]